MKTLKHFTLKYNKAFCRGHVILKRRVYTDKGSGVGKGCNALYL